MTSTVLVSKRGPAEFRLNARTGAVEPRNPHGAATGVVSAMARRLGAGVPWISSATSDGDRQLARAHPDGFELAIGEGHTARVHLLEHRAEVFAAVQDRTSSGLLWQALHGVWDRWSEPTFDEGTRRDWAAMGEFCQDYADRIARVIGGEPGARVVLHDYQFTGLPARLRAAVPDVSICTVIHVAWPDPGQLRVLPRYMREEMIRGLLSSDLVVVLAERWARNILDCAREFGGAELGGRVVVQPLGYSPDLLRQAEFPPEDAQWAAGRPLVVHYGRTDPIKNAPRAIQAFRLALDGEPRLRESRLLVRAAPHHLGHTANLRYLEQLEAEAALTNKELGAETVRVVQVNDVAATFGAYAHADVLVANSVVDGQNVGPFEAAMLNDRLRIVLSENAGAAEVLGEHVLVVNPFDVAEQAEALRRALLTSPSAGLRAAVAPHTWESWADSVLALLAER
ncbi:trehalose-6-phosphate synthase [Crossiella sp. SN42]|uniref:trehalose-6-phosphate synthase n=1 Tax=Crossiella sp. SN42 TaxID=2944808 RepID=UPI00207CB7E5|nr:trehalose-6-phosphate synthase [Crossiella sp. SN42]MCO1575929.1 trehalose-6-phosphate synthase [Crossiella sp. SN42]